MSVTVQPETVAVQAIREHLLLKLPAKCAAINAERAATIRAGTAGPYTIAAALSLKLGTDPGSEATVTLTAGTRTTAQVVTDLAGLTGLTASADDKDRLLISASVAPTSVKSEVSLGADDTGANVVFGWNPGGERNYREPIQPPLRSGILDGDFAELSLQGRFGIIIGDSVTVPDGNLRKDMHWVETLLHLHVPAPGHGSGYKEQVAQSVRAIRESILEDRTLGARIVIAEVPRTVVMGTVFRFEVGDVGLLVARADMQVRCKIFERS